jgi:hypothetical protein
VSDKPEGSGQAQPDAPKGVADHAMVLAEEAQSRGAALAGDAKDHVLSTVDGQRESIAGQVSDVAEAIHHVGEQFKGKQV